MRRNDKDKDKTIPGKQVTTFHKDGFYSNKKPDAIHTRLISYEV